MTGTTSTTAVEPNRLAIPGSLLESKIIAVLRAPRADDYRRLAPVLDDAGLRSLELTLTTPGTIEAVTSIKNLVGALTQVGVGTVLSVVDARRAIDEGADYLVTPVVLPEVIEVAVSAGIPIYPGALTPTEAHKAWSLGATAVKIFPASTVGPEYVGHLHGPFPEMKVIPSGGVTAHAALAWLRAGASAVSLGGPLLGDALRGGDLDLLWQRASGLVREVASL